MFYLKPKKTNLIRNIPETTTSDSQRSTDMSFVKIYCALVPYAGNRSPLYQVPGQINISRSINHNTAMYNCVLGLSP